MSATPAAPMNAGERRGLTDGECALAAGIFGGRLPLAPIRIFQAPPLPFQAMVPLGKTIVFSRWRAATDFSRTDGERQGWFIHELVHCWQAHQGVVLGLAKLRALGLRAYRYEFIPGKPFRAYNIEQQAEIVRALFMARIGRPQSEAPSLAALQQVWDSA